MKKKNSIKKFSKRYLVFILIGIFILVGIVIFNYSKQETIYINEEGETYVLPEKNYVFQISSAEEIYPRFISGEIDPVKVQVGDIQKMNLVIEEDVPLTRVWAEIERDNGISTVDLRLEGIDGDVYTYVGEWEVFDTHTKTYHTTFFAEDEQGRKNELTLAWSDPNCEFIGGYLQGACVLSTAESVAGIDGGNMYLNGQTITLSDGLLVNNEGGSIYLDGGNILLGGGKIIKTGYLYYFDSDGDDYRNEVAMIHDESENLDIGSFVRVKNSLVGIDCDDSDARVNPGQTKYFARIAEGGGFDYNCDGEWELGGFNIDSSEGWETVYPILYKNPDGPCVVDFDVSDGFNCYGDTSLIRHTTYIDSSCETEYDSSNGYVAYVQCR